MIHVAEISTWLLAVVIILVCVLLVCAYVLSIYWTKGRHKPLSHEYTGLYDNARRLGLQVCDVKDKCMYAAVVDQLVVKCPNVEYSTDRLKTMVQASLPTSEDKSGRVLPMLRQRLSRSKVQNELQKDVDKLQALADRLHRVIELVHDDRRDGTVIRPFDLQHDEVIIVLYIGRCCQGFYYSLRPRSASVTNRRRERVENRETVNDQPTNEDRVNVENNVMVGDNNRQYIINRPHFNEDGTVVQHCHIIGNGSTQNILVTVTDSADLSRFFQNDTLSEGKIKIRQSSDNMSTEQIEQGEEAVIQALNDTGGDSDARHELDRILDRFDLTFDRAVRGCMVLQFKAQSKGSFIRFANKFENHDLDILVKYLLKYLLIDKDAKNVTIDLELSIHNDLEAECQKKRAGPVKTKENDKDTDHAYSTGITVYCKPRSQVNDREKFDGEKAHELANDVSTLVTDVVGKTVAQNHLHKLHGEYQACGSEFTFRYQYLLIEIGTKVLRQLFDHLVNHDFCMFLNMNHAANTQLLYLFMKKVITADQQRVLPPIDTKPSSANFDFTLVCCLLRNVCGLKPPNDTSWIKPAVSDTSVEANICRLRKLRNELVHNGTVFDSSVDLEAKWKNLSQILQNINTICKMPNLTALINDAEKIDIDEKIRKQYDLILRIQENADEFESLIQLHEGQEQLKEGLTRLKDGQTRLKDGQTRLKDGQTQLKDGQTRLKDRQTQLKEGQTQLKDGQTRLKDGQTQLKDGQTQLVKGQRNLDLGLAQIQPLIKQEISELKQDIPVMKTGLKTVERHLKDYK